MRVVTKDFLNDNEFKSYPIDIRSTYEPYYSTDEHSSINCVLTDMSITVPEDVAACLFVANISITKSLVSMTIMGAKTHPFSSNTPEATKYSTEYSLLGAYVVATVETRRLANMSGVTVEISPKIAGVGGWVSFGSGASKEGTWIFSGPYSSMISDACITRYSYGGVFTVGRSGYDAQLDGDIQIQGQNGIELEESVDGLIIRFSGTSNDVRQSLRDYSGRCGGRPESETCSFKPIKTINGIRPEGLESEIVLVLDRPLYATIVEPGTEKENLQVSADIPLESFCRGRISIPDSCQSTQGLTNFLRQGFNETTSQIVPDPSIKLVFEVHGAGAHSTSIFDYSHQNPLNAGQAVFKCATNTNVLGESLTEMVVDLALGEWQMYGPYGVSMSLFGSLLGNLRAFKEITYQGNTYQVYIGVATVYDLLDVYEVDVVISAPDSFDEAGRYVRISYSRYVHSQRPEYSLELRGTGNSWVLSKDGTLLAAGILDDQGFDSKVQSYVRSNGEPAVRSLAVRKAIQ